MRSVSVWVDGWAKDSVWRSSGNLRLTGLEFDFFFYILYTVEDCETMNGLIVKLISSCRRTAKQRWTEHRKRRKTSEAHQENTSPLQIWPDLRGSLWNRETFIIYVFCCCFGLFLFVFIYLLVEPDRYSCLKLMLILILGSKIPKMDISASILCTV